MEPTTIKGSDIVIERSLYERNLVRIKQDDDLVVVEDDDVEEFIAAIRNHHARPIEQEPDLVVLADGDGKVFFEAIRNHPPPPMVLEPAPGKWYVVLENSNSRLKNRDDGAVMFTVYSDARIYGEMMSWNDRRYVAISVDEYERAFGR